MIDLSICWSCRLFLLGDFELNLLRKMVSVVSLLSAVWATIIELDIFEGTFVLYADLSFSCLLALTFDTGGYFFNWVCFFIGETLNGELSILLDSGTTTGEFSYDFS